MGDVLRDTDSCSLPHYLTPTLSALLPFSSKWAYFRSLHLYTLDVFKAFTECDQRSSISFCFFYFLKLIINGLRNIVGSFQVIDVYQGRKIPGQFWHEYWKLKTQKYITYHNWGQNPGVDRLWHTYVGHHLWAPALVTAAWGWPEGNHQDSHSGVTEWL